MVQHIDSHNRNNFSIRNSIFSRYSCFRGADMWASLAPRHTVTFPQRNLPNDKGEIRFLVSNHASPLFLRFVPTANRHGDKACLQGCESLARWQYSHQNKFRWSTFLQVETRYQ